MAMAAGAALLRSLATKMARPPPHLPYALEQHGRLPTSSGGLCLPSRFSTSTGGSSMPPSANLRDSSHNKNVSSQLHSAKMSAPLTTETKVLYLAVIGTTAFYFGWFKPRLEAFRDELIALRRERSILIKAVEECQRTHTKARDDSIDPTQAQITQALGHGKEIGGRQAY